MGTSHLDVVYPATGDVILELLCLLHVMSLDENPVHSWMSVGGAFGVASSLRASLFVTGLACDSGMLPMMGEGR